MPERPQPPVNATITRVRRGSVGTVLVHGVTHPLPPVPESDRPTVDPPEDPTKAKLARAARAAAASGSALDELNAEFEVAESVFQRLGINVSAHVRVETEQEEHLSRYTDLAFRRTDEGWKLVIEAGYDGHEEETETTTELCRASRETRLLAATYLPKLLDKMVMLAEADAIRIRESVREVRSFTESLKAASGVK